METGPNPYGCPWESVICAAIGFLAVLLFVWRSCQSVRSRRYLRRESQLALKLAGLNEEKCELLEKVHLVQKEYEGLESSLKDAIFEKESIDAPNLGAICEELDRSKSKLGDEILFLGKELQEEKTKHCQQVEWMADISKRIKSLEDESKALKSQIAEAKTTWRIFHRNEEGSGGAIRKVLDETSQLQESQKQLSQEAEACKEKANDLNKHKITLEDSEVHAEQVLRGKENHIKSLNEHLLKMKDWAPVLVQDPTDDGTLELEIKGESDIGADFDDQPKGVLKKRVYVAKFNGSIETLPGENNQTFTLVSEVAQRKEDLVEHITNLKTEQASLQAENTQFESDNQNLEPKLKAMTELHQENVMNLQKKLIVVENCQVEQEEKLRKVEEKISHTTALLDTYRNRAKDLEEELERTIHFWQGRLIYYEKKAHDNELAAQSAERYLSDLRKQNAHKRRQVREIEFKFQLLEKDPYPLDVSNTASGREHSPNGPSPLGRPSSDENQATGSGSVFPPFPPIRGPWFPVDPRSQFMRRGPFFPLPPPGNMYGAPREYFPPGPPPPPWTVGNGYSPRGFPQYLSPRAGFPPPPALHSESKSEFPAGFIPPTSEPATDHPEPQQEN